MKKIFAICMAVAVIAGSFVGCADKKTTINVYNWGEYISNGEDGTLDVIKEFEKKYPNIRVNYKTFDNNEIMYTQLANGTAKYDVIFPSDYMAGQLIEEGMLAKLNYDNIPNYQYIDEKFKNGKFECDPNNEYTVPYMWGTVGIVYNTKMVNKEVTGWDILWDEDLKGQILMINNSRDAIGIALKRLGYSMNSTNMDELNAAVESLKQQKPLVQAYVADQVFDKMENNEAAVATYYAGDIISMMESNEDLAFCLPEEGSNYFLDVMCVPANAEHKTEAELFINFMCEPEISVANCEITYYSTPLTSAYDILDEDVKNNEIAYPKDEVLTKQEFYKLMPEEIRNYYNDQWAEIMS